MGKLQMYVSQRDIHVNMTCCGCDYDASLVTITARINQELQRRQTFYIVCLLLSKLFSLDMTEPVLSSL